jgi:hypothetical protein
MRCLSLFGLALNELPQAQSLLGRFFLSSLSHFHFLYSIFIFISGRVRRCNRALGYKSGASGNVSKTENAIKASIQTSFVQTICLTICIYMHQRKGNNIFVATTSCCAPLSPLEFGTDSSQSTNHVGIFLVAAATCALFLENVFL